MGISPDDCGPVGYNKCLKAKAFWTTVCMAFADALGPGYGKFQVKWRDDWQFA